MKATNEQREQVQQFFILMSENLDNVILHPVIDSRTREERLGICVVNRTDEANDIYLLGLWLLPGDKLFKQLKFKEDEPEVLTERQGLCRNFVRRVCLYFSK